MNYNDLLAQKPTSPMSDELPLIFKNANGPFLYDLNGNKYIDFMNGKGSLILGHNYKKLNSQLISYLTSNMDVRTGFTESVFILNKQIIRALNFDKIAYFKTGTEAVKAAIYCARKYNGKRIVLSSGYHGYDPIWKFSGKLRRPNQSGVIDFFFDLELLEELVNKYYNQLSAIIISPDPIYLSKQWFNKLNQIIKNKDILLIVDEVKVGFRYNYGFYSTNYNLRPDLGIVSKSIGNGVPLSVLCGSEEVMHNCDNLNYTSFFDSFSFFVATKVLEILKDTNFYSELKQTSTNVLNIINQLIQEFDLPIIIKSNDSIFQFLFPTLEVSNLFFKTSIKHGLIFYPGDNQCLSYSFNQDDVCIDIKEKFTNLFQEIKKHFLFKNNQKANLEWEIITAWNLMDGLPDVFIPKKLKTKLLRELPE